MTGLPDGISLAIRSTAADKAAMGVHWGYPSRALLM